MRSKPSIGRIGDGVGKWGYQTHTPTSSFFPNSITGRFFSDFNNRFHIWTKWSIKKNYHWGILRTIHDQRQLWDQGRRRGSINLFEFPLLDNCYKLIAITTWIHNYILVQVTLLPEHLCRHSSYNVVFLYCNILPKVFFFNPKTAVNCTRMYCFLIKPSFEGYVLNNNSRGPYMTK